MKTKIRIVILVLASVGVLASCGPSREEVERERQRLQLEEQAQRDIQKSNQAVNEVSKKLGRKPPTLDLGLSPEKKAEPPRAPTPASKP